MIESSRRGFLAGLLAVTATVIAKPALAIAKPIVAIANKVPAIKKLWGLDELVAWATRTKLAEEALRPEVIGYVDDTLSTERRQASDALGRFIITDMYANPDKYRPPRDVA